MSDNQRNRASIGVLEGVYPLDTIEGSWPEGPTTEDNLTRRVSTLTRRVSTGPKGR